MKDPLEALRKAHTLEEKADAVREIAARAGALREPLARALESAGDDTRIDLLNAVGASRDPSVADLVEAVLGRRASADVLRTAAIALGNLGGPHAFDRLAALLRHRDPLVRLGAIRGLAILRDPRAIAPLSDLVDDAATAWPKSAGVKAGGYVIGNEATRAIREIRGSGRE